MGRRVHKKNATVPAANREPAKKGLGYAEAGHGRETLGEGLRSLARAQSQMAYPDLTALSDKSTEAFLKENDVLSSCDKNGLLEDKDLQITCWKCMNPMSPLERAVNPSYGCGCDRSKPRLSQAMYAYTPIYGSIVRGGAGASVGTEEQKQSQLLARVIWCVGNARSPGYTTDQVRGNGVDISSDGVDVNNGTSHG